MFGNTDPLKLQTAAHYTFYHVIVCHLWHGACLSNTVFILLLRDFYEDRSDVIQDELCIINDMIVPVLCALLC